MSQIIEKLLKEIDEETYETNITNPKENKISTYRRVKYERKSYPLMENILKRRAVSRWGNSTVSKDDLELILETGYTSHQFDEVPIDYLVIVKNVDGLSQGFYKYQEGKLSAYKDTNVDELRSMFLQLEFADAPVTILIYGHLEHELVQKGTKGYRDLLIKAGIVSNRLWLSTVDLGM
ncbi:nitroreductase family protein [Bacillus sp. JCM 19041]|uniref:nitroreductase family protein n=1 Tax=Bacillus sp. JCM 19041 TaxID=1460637 RepID=UPI0006CF4EC0